MNGHGKGRMRVGRAGVMLMTFALLAGACGDDDATSAPAEDGAPTGDIDAQAALDALEGQVLSTGPGGEEPSLASDVSLTDAELQQIADMDATAAIVMHYAGNDWAQAQIDGLTAQFEEMGIDVVATTDANFEAETQVSDIETVLAEEPDIIVSIPTEPTGTASAYQRAADEGVQLVFMDNVPEGMEQGTDYVSVVSADNYGNGVVAAHLMAEALGGEGEIGVVFHDADFFVTRQRYEAFTATIEEDYPNIEIAEEQGIGGPDFAGDAEAATAAMLTSNPDLDGIWGVWDVPSEGIMAAARSAGRADLAITTIDLGENVAISIAEGGLVRGLGAQLPYDQGVTEALLAGYGLLDKEAPAYVVLPALPVQEDNVLEAWETVYHAPPPEALADAAE